VLWSSGFVGSPSHQLSPCWWLVPCLLFYTGPCTLLCPLLCLLLVCVFVLILRARVWYSPNWWIQAMVPGVDAMVNGVLTGVLLKQCSLANWWMMAWTSGSLDHWWMMLTVPCWYCACARYCDIPSFPAKLISSSVFPHACLCRVFFPYGPLTLEVADCLDIDACNLKSFSIMCSTWLLLFVLQRYLEWWLSFNFSLQWFRKDIVIFFLLFSYCCLCAIWIRIILSYCNACLGICSNLKVTFYMDTTFVAGVWRRARFCLVIFSFFFFWLFC